MARRKNSAENPQRSVKTSVSFDVADLARIKAAAALSGKAMSRYIEEVVLEATRGLVVIDKRRERGQVNPSAQEEESAADAA